jgi:hypothetical protein
MWRGVGGIERVSTWKERERAGREEGERRERGGRADRHTNKDKG